MNAHVDRTVVIGDATLNHETPNRLPMKSFDSRTYSINDFVEWDEAGQLVLNARFQRRSVWSPKAKSYLIDTILRGKPISKVFIRQKINTTTKNSIREIVDGQQRLRTILSFVSDGFTVSRNHNREFGGIPFSRMSESVQTQILSYEIAVDLLINLPDSEILDIFGRLNSYAIVLNEQERLNASHFGPFKQLADDVARSFYGYWLEQKIFTEKQLLRMLEVNLTADILVAITAGIKSKKQIGIQYRTFEDSFPYDVDILTSNFNETIGKISEIYPDGLFGTEFNRPFLFYTLFTSIHNCLFGLPGMDECNLNLRGRNSVAYARFKLDRVSELFEAEDVAALSRPERVFLQDCRRATTDGAARIRRTKFLLDLLSVES